METSLRAVWDTLCKLSFTLLYFFFTLGSAAQTAPLSLLLLLILLVACENISFCSLFAASSARNVPSGEERGETDVFAGYPSCYPGACVYSFCLISSFSADEDHDGSLDKMKTKVKVDHNGTNQWLAPLMLKSFCKINVRYFPFDEQVSLQLSKVLIWPIDIKNTVEVVVLFNLSTS